MEKIGRFWKKKQGVRPFLGANSYIIPFFYYEHSFLQFSTISRCFPHFLLTAFPCKYVLLQLWKMFLVRTVWLIPANGRVSNMVAYFSRRRLNGLVLLVIGGRSNACCAFLAGLQYSVLPLIGCATSFTCAGHFLAFMSCF